jgi:diadenosine tetraphosphate (Ap4A) HIT family hydrolase
METNEEGVRTVYKDKELIAIVKRDDHSKKHLVYMVKEATSEDIISLIAPKV